MRNDDLSDRPILKRSRARLARLRGNFFERFREVMDRPVLLAENECMEDPIICWRDAGGAFNGIQVMSYWQPNDRYPRRPMLPRIHLNYWHVSNREDLARRIDCVPGTGAKWQAQITVMERELDDFAGWIAALVRVVDGLEPMPIPAPPHPCHFGTPAEPISGYVWSVAAWDASNRHDGSSLEWPVGEPPPMRAAG